MKNASFFRGLLLLCYFLVSDQSFAISHSDLVVAQQQTQITGTVKVDGMPMTGVSISVLGKQATAVSGEDGKFTITAEPTDTLVFAFVGFKTVTEPLNGRTSINIQLQEDTTTLQEVTVNAGYYSVKEKERTGSIAKIKAADIEKQPVTNPLAAMEGRMAGVNITQAAGTPGSGFSIQVRGVNSIRAEGNDPLYVVDGVPYASQSLGNNNVGNYGFGGLSSPISNINPADIESIEVLKDADATAIYGSRGANGVVLITTKKGKAGRTKFDVQSYTTIGQVTQKADLLNTQEYLAMRQEAFANDGVTEYPADAYDINGTWDQTRNTNWQKELIGGTANIYNAQLSISGGSNFTQFLVSGTYRKETTVFPGEAHYSRGGAHVGITHRSEDERFKLNFSADYTGDKNTLPGIDLTRLSYTLAPNAPSLYDAAGNLNWEDGTFDNPLGILNSSYLNNTNTLIANAMLSYKLPKGFELKTSLGFSDTSLSETRLLPSTIYSPFFNVTSADSEILLNDGARRSWIIEPQLTWQKKWEILELNVLAGSTFQTEKQHTLAFDGLGFPSNALINTLSAATSLTVLSDDYSEYKYNAFFGRVNLNLKEKYILNLTGRRDGSSRFGPSNRFANFGAVGAAWIFSKEAFLKNADKVLSFGKLRASYGVAGNDQIGDYQYLDTYQVSPNVYDGVTGIQPSRLFNANFGWETNKKLEAALELGFLNDRIFLTTAYFKNRSTNQLVGIPLPGTTGFSSLLSNLDATVENTGLELELRTVNFKGKDFGWTTMLNFTAPKNRLVEFPNLENSVYKNLFVIGESLSIQKLYHYTGIDPETGLYQFEDYNGDGAITSSADRQGIVDTAPKYYGGLANQFTYKNWSLDFLFQFVKQDGKSIISSFPLTGTFSNQPSQVLTHVPQDNSPDAVQQYSNGDLPGAVAAYNNYTLSDAMVEDASFVRLKSLSLAYNIPALWSKSFSGRIYLQGQNLLTFTEYHGADPETRTTFYVPPLRQFTLGVQFSF